MRRYTVFIRTYRDWFVSNEFIKNSSVINVDKARYKFYRLIHSMEDSL